MSKYERQLESYAVASKSLLRSQNRRTRHGSWYLYAAASSSALALATSASADIIYGIQDISVSAFGFADTNYAAVSSAPIDMAGGRFRIHASQATSGFPLAHNHAYGLLIASGGSFLKGPEGVRGIASGARISAGGSFGMGRGVLGGGGLIETQFGGLSSFRVGSFPSVGIAGVRFTTGPGKPHFGWIRLGISIPPLFNNVTVTAIDWAYNDVVGAPIDAGQTTTPIPEPSMIPMGLLALGSAGVLAWRRRRKEVAG